MIAIKKMENAISWILLLGIFCSASMVLVGGILYLMQYGGENARTILSPSAALPTHLQDIWVSALSGSPSGIIELGIVLLVFTQIMRVGLLAWFYAWIKDFWFTGISLFILLALIYSFLYR